MSATIKIRRDLAATWTSANPVLASGEFGLETDTRKLKLGDGTTAWTSLAYSAAGTTAAAISDSTATGRSVLTAADAGAARTAIGAGTSSLAIGTSSSTAKAGDYQPTAANISDATAVGRTVLTAANAAAQRTALGLVIATDVEAHDADLTTIAGLSPSNDDVIQRKSGVWTNRTMAQVKTDLAVVAADVTNSTTVGRAVLTAADAAAARAAIGTGNSLVTRRVTHLLSGSGGLGGSFNTTTHDYNTRLPIVLPVTPTRYRFRIRNRGRKNGVVQTGTIAGSGIWMGAPEVSASTSLRPYRWSGNLAATPTQVQTSFTLTNSTEFTTAWITSPQIVANVTAVASVALTNVGGAGAVSVTGDVIGGLSRLNAGAVAAAATAAFTPNTGTVYFHIAIEYEYECAVQPDGTPEVPIVLFLGDSITEGAVPTGQTYAFWRHEVWPGQAALRNGFCAVNAGISGLATGNWKDATTVSHQYLEDFDLTTTVPDWAVIALGINDAAAASPLTTQQDNIATIVTNLRSMGINRIALCTNIPGGFATTMSVTGGATTNAAATVTVTSTAGLRSKMAITGTGIPASTTILSVESATQMTLSANATATNTGLTFTIGTTGYLTTQAKESLRQQINDWIRTYPLSVDAVFDFDNAIADPIIPSNPLGHLVPITPHPNLGGHVVLAERVRLA